LITVLLADAALELMPPELRRHPKVLARAKRRRRDPERLLLDQALDHEAMRGLRDAERRGRPDITHVCLLLLLDSPLNAAGRLRVLVHTQDDALIRVDPATRIMRNGAKFAQLVEDLLRQGEVPAGRPLLTLERGVRLPDALPPGPVVLLDEAGTLARTPEFARLARAHPDLTLVLGAFPRGAIREPPRADHVLRVADAPLSAWSALVPALAGFEDALLLSGGG
jgi:rRNA small subunit pseudouridine methyltransferase Nep1